MRLLFIKDMVNRLCTKNTLSYAQARLLLLKLICMSIRITYVCIYVCMYVCNIYRHTYIHTCTHKHTHTHTHTQYYTFIIYAFTHTQACLLPLKLGRERKDAPKAPMPNDTDVESDLERKELELGAGASCVGARSRTSLRTQGPTSRALTKMA